MTPEGPEEPSRENGGGGGGGGGGNGEQQERKKIKTRVRRTCTGVRILEDPNDTTHGLMVNFKLPKQGTGKLDLCILGEDGTKDQVRMTSVKWRNAGEDMSSEREATISADGCSFVVPSEVDAQRVRVRMKTMEPVTGAGLVLLYEQQDAGAKL